MSTAGNPIPTPLGGALVKSLLPPRPAAAHKGSFGRLLVVAGSRRYRGAALLAAEGALRSGVGLVQLAAIECVCAAAAVRLPCCTLLPLKEDDEGGIAPAALRHIDYAWPTALLAGSGMGLSAATADVVAALLQNARCPLVLDADALNALGPLLAKQPTLLQSAAHPVILTPHVGEMARLCGQNAAAVTAAQQQTALDYANKQRCTVVLKSHQTVVASPGGQLFLNAQAGNAGLAKGGSGDVLAGIIAALAAQGMPAVHAAAAGVWLHAAAADEVAKTTGQAALSPADLPGALGRVLLPLGW